MEALTELTVVGGVRRRSAGRWMASLVASASKLQKLRLWWIAGFEGAELAALARLHSLRDLYMASVSRSFEAPVDVLAQLTQLTNLSIGGCHPIEAAAIELLAAMQLESLEINVGAGVSAQHLVCLSRMTTLRHLLLRGGNQLTKEGVKAAIGNKQMSVRIW